MQKLEWRLYRKLRRSLPQCRHLETRHARPRKSNLSRLKTTVASR